MPWTDATRLDLTKDLLALANHADGGSLVLGIAEGRGTDGFEKKGVELGHKSTWDFDVVRDFVSSCGDPGVTLDMSFVREEEREFLLIEVKQFREVPIVCKKHFARGGSDVLRVGAIYYRTTEGRPQSREATAEDIRNLLDLSFRNRLLLTAQPLLTELQKLIPVKRAQDQDRVKAQLGDFFK